MFKYIIQVSVMPAQASPALHHTVTRAQDHSVGPTSSRHCKSSLRRAWSYPSLCKDTTTTKSRHYKYVAVLQKTPSEVSWASKREFLDHKFHVKNCSLGELQGHLKPCPGSRKHLLCVSYFPTLTREWGHAPSSWTPENRNSVHIIPTLAIDTYTLASLICYYSQIK